MNYFFMHVISFILLISVNFMHCQQAVYRLAFNSSSGRHLPTALYNYDGQALTKVRENIVESEVPKELWHFLHRNEEIQYRINSIEDWPNDSLILLHKQEEEDNLDKSHVTVLSVNGDNAGQKSDERVQLLINNKDQLQNANYILIIPSAEGGKEWKRSHILFKALVIVAAIGMIWSLPNMYYFWKHFPPTFR